MGADEERDGPPDVGPAPEGKVKKRRVPRSQRARATTSPPAEGTVMEPVVTVEEAGSAPGEEATPREEAGTLEEVHLERDVVGTALYRERRIVEEVVEEEVPRARQRRRAAAATGGGEVTGEGVDQGPGADGERAAATRHPVASSSLAYKTFYDLVCNRLGIIVIGFGTAMLVFVMFYDALQGRELSIGVRHWTAIAASLAVYALGFGLEMLRAWSWECDRLDEAGPLGATPTAAAGGGARTRVDEASIPLVPEDAVEELLRRNGGT